MTAFQYRAIGHDGSPHDGVVDAIDRAGAFGEVRRLGLQIVEVRPLVAANDGSDRISRYDRNARNAVVPFIGEVAVLLKAGLSLDRALALAIENVSPKTSAVAFIPLLKEVREGRSFANAMAATKGLFTPVAVAMTEAGEANGKLAASLADLADMLEREADLRKLVTSAMIYPAALTIIAVAVILVMLLFVVPQFETLLGQSRERLPTASRFVLAASAMLRDYGWWLLIGLVGFVVMIRAALLRPGARLTTDALILRLPLVGDLVRRTETTRFARTLGALVEGEVALPSAVALARRTVRNSHMGKALEDVANGIRRGGGLARPISEAKVLPDIANGFIRTGEESSELALMLARLADVLDRDVKVRLQRLVAVLTPIITIVLAAIVTTIIASVMSAILGFNEVAISQ